MKPGGKVLLVVLGLVLVGGGAVAWQTGLLGGRTGPGDEGEGGPPPDFWSRYQEGLQKVKVGDYGGAVESIQSALEIEPNHPGANYELAGLYQILGDNQRSLECITVAVENAPEPSVLYLARYVKALVSVGRVEEAALNVGKIIELDPSMATAYRDYCTIHLKIFKLDEVIAMATRAIDEEIDPKYPFFRSQMHHLRGQAYQKKDEFESAEKDYRTAIEACPQYPKPYHDLGRLLVRRGEKEEGEKLLAKHAKLNKVQEEIEKVYTHLGQTETALPVHLKQLISYHSLLGQFREAENAADNLLSKNPQDADAMVRMGVVKIFLSEYPQAIGYFRRAIDADPTFINSYEELALLLATAQDEQYRDVEESLRVVDAARPFGGVGAHVMAEIYHASGETERAITTLRRGLARGEGEPSIVKARIRELEAALEGDAGPEDAPPEPSDPGETSEPPGPEEETRTAAGDVPSEEG